MFKPRRHSLLIGLLLATPVGAQLLGGGGQLGGGQLGGLTQPVREIGQATRQAVGGTMQGIGAAVTGPGGSTIPPQLVQQAVEPGAALNSVMAPVGHVTTNAEALLQLRAMRHGALVNQFRNELEVGDGGVPIRRGQLLLTNPTRTQLDAAVAAGFPVLKVEQDAALGLSIVTVGVPPKLAARKALKKLAATVPGIPADVDPLFEPAGGGGLAPLANMALAGGATATGAASRARVAMIDGGVAAHPSMARASIEQKGFAGRAEATGHGTAVASLLVGDQAPFRGAARGATLFVADVYGGNPSAGSASAIVQALSWAVSKRPQVISMSLVGPPNMAIERAISAVMRMGIKVVAAVGNDGPAAPPAYPASYDGVLAVTGVDAKGRALAEAGKPRHLDFAAPGAAMAAALPGKGYADVRGTSFAAPLAAARLMATGSAQALAGEAVPGKGRVGRGIVCSSCRIAPSVVGAS